MPFVKGQSGNPAGRPEGSISIVTEIKRQLMEEVIVDAKDGKIKRKKKIELLVQRAMKKAIEDGDTKMITDIIDRVDGKALQKADVMSGGKEIKSFSIVPVTINEN